MYVSLSRGFTDLPRFSKEFMPGKQKQNNNKKPRFAEIVRREKLRPTDEKASCLKSNNRDILKQRHFSSDSDVTFTVLTLSNSSLLSLQP